MRQAVFFYIEGYTVPILYFTLGLFAFWLVARKQEVAPAPPEFAPPATKPFVFSEPAPVVATTTPPTPEVVSSKREPKKDKSAALIVKPSASQKREQVAQKTAPTTNHTIYADTNPKVSSTRLPAAATLQVRTSMASSGAPTLSAPSMAPLVAVQTTTQTLNRGGRGRLN